MQKEIDRLNQAKQISEEVIKTLQNLTSIRIETVPDKENKLNNLQKNLERERGITQIITRDNVELKKEIIQTQTQQQKIQMENAELRKEIMQIRAKQQQTQTECNEKTNEINKINEELKHAKRELTQLTKKIDIVKENNVTLNKKFKDQKNESEQQIVTLKAINLDLENKVNKKNMNNEPTTCKQDQQHQQQSNREIIQKGTQEKHSIYVIDLLEQSIKDQQLQEITKKYGKVIDHKIRKDGNWKIGNIAIVTFSTEESAEKTITGINKTNKYIAKNMNMKPVLKCF